MGCPLFMYEDTTPTIMTLYKQAMCIELRIMLICPQLKAVSSVSLQFYVCMPCTVSMARGNLCMTS